jgi:hypothetical protein
VIHELDWRCQNKGWFTGQRNKRVLKIKYINQEDKS